jgi:hypothetical protein
LQEIEGDAFCTQQRPGRTLYLEQPFALLDTVAIMLQPPEDHLRRQLPERGFGQV